MAINIPIITSLEDTGIKNAKAAFNDFKTAVGKAEGGMGKFKAGSNVALDAVKANAGNLAMVAGTAIATFAVKAVGDFQKVAIEAGKFAEATGLAVEDASRYIEVAGDIGIPIDAVEGAIGRLNKTIGADPDKVRDLGVDLVYLKDGSLDVNETFLNTIDRIKGIKDPAEKARVAAQLLGKGWQDMSELIGMGADDLQRSLDGVSDAKVISKEELKKARDFRDAMDDLKGVSEDLTLAIGGALIPALTDLAEAAKDVNDAIGLINKIPGVSWLFDKISPLGPAVTAFGLLEGAVSGVISIFKDAEPNLDLAYETYQKVKGELKATKEETERLETATKNSTVAVVNAETAWRNLTGTLDREVALDNAKIDLQELEAAAALAFSTGAQADVDAYEASLANFATALSNISGGIDDVSSKKILLRFETQGGAAAIALAEWYAGTGSSPIGSGGIDPSILRRVGVATVEGERALGGPVAGGSSYLVGERGPELFTPTMGGNITPNGALGGGANITVNVNGGDPEVIVRALQKYVRANGAVSLATSTLTRY